MAQLLFAKEYGYDAPLSSQATIQASNKDFILVGRVYDDPTKALIIRTHPNGNIIWKRVFETNHGIIFESIAQLADGTFVAIGTSFHSEYDKDSFICIVQLDANGHKRWEANLGEEKDKNNGVDVTATSDGGFIVIGTIIDERTSQSLAIKYDKKFNQVWTKALKRGLTHSVKQTKDGGYVLCGASNSTGTLNSNVYVVRLDSGGNICWEKVYKDRSIYVLIDSDIIEDCCGDLVVAAKTTLMKLDACGNEIWARQNKDIRLYTLVQMPDCSYAIGGGLVVSSTEHAYLAVVDQDGKNIIFDNTEIVLPSNISQLFVNSIGFLTGGVTIDDKMHLITVHSPKSVFNEKPSRSLSEHLGNSEIKD